jgi:hypothetical protein
MDHDLDSQKRRIEQNVGIGKAKHGKRMPERMDAWPSMVVRLCA